MKQNKKYGHRYCTALIAAILLMAAGTIPAYAEETGDNGRTGSTEASISFTAGTLRLASVPVLDFGSQNVSAEEETYRAANISSPIQVSDLRGSGKGWELLVSLSEFTLEDGVTPTLKAAGIEISAPTVMAVNGNIGTPPSTPVNLVLTSDNTETRIWTADVNEGMGVWDLVWHEDNTRLRVKPGTAQEGTSAATLTWTLQTAP